MCSRYSLTSPPEAVRSYFGTVNRPNFPARYNIAPTQPVAIVRRDDQGQRELATARWGLVPAWVKEPKTFATLINARCETVCDKPAFRNAMRHRRCLIPADGFYEWTGGKGAKRPFFIHRRDRAPIAFAGLWERYAAPEGGEVQSAVIITTAANRTLQPLHDRMPAILEPETFAAWLDTGSVSADVAAALLLPVRDDLLEFVEVNPRINNSRIEEPGVRMSLQGEAF